MKRGGRLFLVRPMMAVVALLGTAASSVSALAARSETPSASMALQRLLVRSASHTTQGTSLRTQFGRALRTNAVVRASGVGDNQLRLPPAAFSPATLSSSLDYPTDATGADKFVFRTNHYWTYEHLGMQGGYVEAASFQDANGSTLVFAWLGSSYSTATQASAAMGDASHRTASGSGDQGTDCATSVKVPCRIFVYTATDGEVVSYIVIQVGQCVGETGASAPNQQTFSNDRQQMVKTQAVMVVVGVAVLKQACTGQAQSVPQTTATPTSSPPWKTTPKGQTAVGTFTGNCFTYRSEMWAFNQQTAQMQSQWWQLLQEDYQSTYPTFSGGSTSGPTQDQIGVAQADMQTMHNVLVPFLSSISLYGHSYGITDITLPGRYPWATQKVFMGAAMLDTAARDEMKTPGSGLSDYHLAQQNLSNAWDALKQLPCA